MPMLYSDWACGEKSETDCYEAVHFCLEKSSYEKKKKKKATGVRGREQTEATAGKLPVPRKKTFLHVTVSWALGKPRLRCRLSPALFPPHRSLFQSADNGPLWSNGLGVRKSSRWRWGAGRWDRPLIRIQFRSECCCSGLSCQHQRWQVKPWHPLPPRRPLQLAACQSTCHSSDQT